KTLAALGAGVAGVLVLGIVFVLVLTRGGGAQTLTEGGVALVAADAGTSTQSAAGGNTPPPPRPEVEEQIKDGIALVKKGDYASATEQLTALAEANPGRADIHRALVDAYMATKRPSDAMDEAEKTIGIDPNMTKENELRAHIRNAALTGGKDAED